MYLITSDPTRNKVTAKERTGVRGCRERTETRGCPPPARRAMAMAGIPLFAPQGGQKQKLRRPSPAPLKTTKFCGAKRKNRHLRRPSAAPGGLVFACFASQNRQTNRAKPHFLRVLRFCPCWGRSRGKLSRRRKNKNTNPRREIGMKPRAGEFPPCGAQQKAWTSGLENSARGLGLRASSARRTWIYIRTAHGAGRAG